MTPTTSEIYIYIVNHLDLVGELVIYVVVGRLAGNSPDQSHAAADTHFFPWAASGLSHKGSHCVQFMITLPLVLLSHPHVQLSPAMPDGLWPRCWTQEQNVDKL